jgi:hypothetical protein
MISYKDSETLTRARADELRAAMINYLEEGVKSWLRERQDLQMWDMIVTDVHDLGVVLNYLEEGDFKKAWFEASMLETVPREEIPPLVWKFLERKSK